MAVATTASNLLDLPQELLEHIAAFLTPCDITRLGRTCRNALDFIASDNLVLWRDAFLREFDDPNNRWRTLLPTAKKAHLARHANWDWYSELRRRLAAVKASDGFHSSDHSDLDEVAETVLDIIDTATVAPGQSSELGRNLSKFNIAGRQAAVLEKLFDAYNVDHESALHISPLLNTARHFTRSMARQNRLHRSDAICRLHVLYGLTIPEFRDECSGSARRLTYDWSLTGPASDHGPYHLDGSGRINWQLLEAVCSVIGRNLVRCIAGYMTIPQELGANLPHRLPLDPTVPHDWARATGSFVGTYSFIDYHDLLHFNVGYMPGPRPSLDNDLDACGDLMRFELELDDSEKVKNDWRLKTDLPVCEDLPVLFFSGTSRGYAGPPRPMINVRGRVSLEPGGREVRWRYLIR